MLLTVFSVIISCNKAGENEYIISGTVKGIADGKTVILEKQDGMGQFIPLDTVKVKNGKFVMEGSAKEPEIMMIQVEALQGKVPFVLENGDINLIIDKDSLQKSKFSGTFNNDVFTKFNDDLTKFQKEFQKKFSSTKIFERPESTPLEEDEIIKGYRNDFAVISQINGVKVLGVEYIDIDGIKMSFREYVNYRNEKENL